MTFVVVHGLPLPQLIYHCSLNISYTKTKNFVWLLCLCPLPLNITIPTTAHDPGRRQFWCRRLSCPDHAIDQLPTAIAPSSLNESTFHIPRLISCTLSHFLIAVAKTYGRHLLNDYTRRGQRIASAYFSLPFPLPLPSAPPPPPLPSEDPQICSASQQSHPPFVSYAQVATIRHMRRPSALRRRRALCATTLSAERSSSLSTVGFGLT